MKVLYWAVSLLTHFFIVSAEDKLSSQPQQEAFTLQLTKGIMAFEVDIGAHGSER